MYSAVGPGVEYRPINDSRHEMCSESAAACFEWITLNVWIMELLISFLSINRYKLSISKRLEKSFGSYGAFYTWAFWCLVMLTSWTANSIASCRGTVHISWAFVVKSFLLISFRECCSVVASERSLFANERSEQWLATSRGRSPSKLATKKRKTDKLTKLERHRKKHKKQNTRLHIK